MKKGKRIAIILTACACVCLVVIGVIITINQMNKITFTVNDTLPDGEGKRATVILLGGQSNASGCSHDEYLRLNVSADKYEEYKNGYENVYINYLSGARVSNEFVKCASLQGEPEGCFGPELGMAEWLSETYPDRTFFIIKCAWGGTNLFEEWLSPSSVGKTGKLYKQFVEFVRTSVKYLESKNYDVKIEAMCWMQGESDSFSVENATDYEMHLDNFISDVRKEFKPFASDDGIAFVDAYIADNSAYWVYCDLVNESKRKVAEVTEINVVVDTLAAGLTCSEEPTDAPDLAHYDSLSEIKLGRLFGEAASVFFD